MILIRIFKTILFVPIRARTKTGIRVQRQCCGSGSGRIRFFGPLIRIRIYNNIYRTRIRQYQIKPCIISRVLRLFLHSCIYVTKIRIRIRNTTHAMYSQCGFNGEKTGSACFTERDTIKANCFNCHDPTLNCSLALLSWKIRIRLHLRQPGAGSKSIEFFERQKAAMKHKEEYLFNYR